jgi:hypothetical protein
MQQARTQLFFMILYIFGTKGQYFCCIKIKEAPEKSDASQAFIK